MNETSVRASLLEGAGASGRDAARQLEILAHRQPLDASRGHFSGKVEKDVVKAATGRRRKSTCGRSG